MNARTLTSVLALALVTLLTACAAGQGQETPAPPELPTVTPGVPSILLPTPPVTPTGDEAETWETYNGNYVTFEFPGTWTPAARALFGGAILEEVNLGIPGVEGDQVLGFSAVSCEEARPDDVAAEEEMTIAGQPAVKWIRTGPNYVSYDYCTAGPENEGSFVIHVTAGQEDEALERQLDRLAQSVRFVAPQEAGKPAVVDDWSSTSPTGMWVAEGLTEYLTGDEQGNYRARLTLARTDGTIEWGVVDDIRPAGLGQTIPRPFHWSRDGRYFYFTNFPMVDGCAPFVDGSDLHRVDLSDGRVTEIIPTDGARVLALSPDETTLASIGWGGSRELVLHDLATGTERRIELMVEEGAGTGEIIWSPDGAVLLVTAASNQCVGDTTHSILKVDLATSSQTTLLENDARLLIPVEWSSAGEVLLEDKDGDAWRLDPETGELSKAD